MRVRRRADANRKETGSPEAATNLGKELVLIANRSICEEYHLPQKARVIDIRVNERRFECWQHHCPALSVELGNKALGVVHVLAVRHHGPGENSFHRVIKPDDIKSVCGGKPVKRQQQARLGLAYGLPTHGARVIKDKDDLTGLCLKVIG